MAEVVLLETLGATRVIVIHRPEARNALTRPVLRQMAEALDAANRDGAIRCVVIAGAGDHFCAGADLRQNVADDPQMMDHLDGYLDDFHGVIKAIVRCEKPTIAMMDGAAVGFGADLAFACDLRIASTRAYAQEKFVRIGLMPDGGGTFWLPRLLGTARAMQAILLSEKMSAAELNRLGAIARVIEPDELRRATLDVAREIETGPPLAHAEIKRAIYASWGNIEDALRREREGQLRLLRSADFMEGVSAWMQKREPRFEGK
ncbi:MAG: enoyl-CoA hydratase-related protein [Polyangiaceae bacterium]